MCHFVFNVVTLLVLQMTSTIFADIITVDPAGGGDFTTIQAAIDDVNTVAGDIVVVKPGTYVENIDLMGKAITLRSLLPTSPAVVASTIIDGGAVKRVIVCKSGETSATIISGFLITNGVATNFGGGMCNRNSSSPTVSYCAFSGNTADGDGFGGGMYNEAGSAPTVIECAFIGNTAIYGGGMYNDATSPTVRDCVFINNTADDAGGGMCNMTCSPLVSGCTFSNNTSGNGGGMLNYQSFATVNDCTFSGNTADFGNGGGGMQNIESSPTINSCRFMDNYAIVSGGGILNNPSSPMVSYCTFIANTTSGSGGGMYNNSSSRPTVTGCVIGTNTANHGGGIFNTGTSLPVISNCIMWANNAVIDGDQIFNNGPSDIPEISYCDIQHSGGSGENWNTDLGDDRGGNIDVAPLFVDANGADNVYGTEDDDIQLLAGSPCIDAGNNLLAALDRGDMDGDGITTEWIQSDPAGNERFMDDTATVDTGVCGYPNLGVIDIGVYEYPGLGKLEGDIDGDGDVDFEDFTKLAANWLVGTE